MSNNKVCVIMSTYNGERYLKTQLDSILAQKGVNISLYVFDDVSSDGTLKILQEYAARYSNIHIKVNETNKNYNYNFIDALFSFKDNNEFDYYAFSDQDDYWAEDKLISAIKKLEKKGECSLYASNLKIVDENLNYSGRNYRNAGYLCHYPDQLLFCVTIGNTAVFDSKFKDLVTKYYPKDIASNAHDHWVGLIANYCKGANFIFDMCPEHILYRQHNHNTSSGFVKFGLKKIITRWFKGYTSINFDILKLFIKYYKNELSDNNRELIEKLIDYRHNKKFLINNIDCSNKNKFKLKLIFNRYTSDKKEKTK